MTRIVIEWLSAQPSGRIQAIRCQCGELRIERGSGHIENHGFQFSCPGNCRLSVDMMPAQHSAREGKPIATVRGEPRSFSFFLSDVRKSCPIYMPEYGIIFTEADDPRDYRQIATGIMAKKLVSNLEKYRQDSRIKAS